MVYNIINQWELDVKNEEKREQPSRDCLQFLHLISWGDRAEVK